MKYKLLLIILLNILLTGCTQLTFDIDELMQPPSLSAEQTKIMNALKESLGTESLKLKYPRFGKYRSAFVFKDLNNDEKDEAIVFYEQSLGSGSITRINIMDNDKNEGWHSVYDTPGFGSDVEFIEFAHLTSNKKNDILIGWSTGTSDTDTILSSHAYIDQKLVKTFDENYSLYKLLERENNMQELIIISSARQDPTVKLIKKRTDTKLGIASIAKLNPEIREYSNVVLGNINKNERAIFVDEVLQNGMVATEVIVIKNTLLNNAMIGSDLTTNDIFSQTIRSDNVNCEDIDNDKIVEIPSQTLLPGYGLNDELENVYLTSYNMLVKKEENLKDETIVNMEEDKLVAKENAIINKKDGYKIILPEKWIDKITVKIQPQSGEYSFLVFKDTLEKSTSELLRIRVYSKNDYRDKFELEQFKNIGTKGLFEYFAYIPEDADKNYKINYNDLQSMFVFLK